MVKANGSQEIRTLYPRLIHFGMDYGDLTQISVDPHDWASWSRAVVDQGRKYEAGAEEAWINGRKVSAIEWWGRASIHFHYAQLRLFDSKEKREHQADCRRNFSKIAPHIDPEAVRLEVPYGSALLPGHLRVAHPGAPCVILIGGLDSTKEVELHFFAEIFLKRGNSVFLFDGPGQGEMCERLPMTADFNEAVSAVIDHLTANPLVGTREFGVFGVSFGGYLACRAAAADSRVNACVSLGGFFDSRIFERLSPIAVATVRRAFGFDETGDLGPIAPQVTLEPLRGCMDRPLFVVHGRNDFLVDMAQVAALSDWACGPKRVWIMDEAEHVCTNRFSECLPEIGDWMSEQLARSNGHYAATTANESSYEQEVH